MGTSIVSFFIEMITLALADKSRPALPGVALGRSCIENEGASGFNDEGSFFFPLGLGLRGCPFFSFLTYFFFN